MEAAAKVGVTQTIVPLLQEMLEEDERVMSQMRHRLQRNMITDSSTMVAWLLCRHIFSVSAAKSRGPNFVKSMLELSDSKFKMHLNISKPVFHALVKICINNTTSEKRNLFQVQFNVAVTLWYLTKLEPITVIGTRFGISSKKILMIVTRTCEAICTATEQYITWSSGEEEPYFLCKESKMQVIQGVLNTIHVQVKSRDIDNPKAYENKTGTKTVATQLVVRQDGHILDCFAFCPGNMTNADVLVHSGLPNKIGQYANTQEYCIVADATFPLKPWLLTPFDKIDDELPPHQEKYNELLKTTSEVFSQTATKLLGRFQRLNKMEVDFIEAAGVYIVACAIIHNMCLKGKVDYNSIEGETSLALGTVNGRSDSVSDDPETCLFRQNLAQKISEFKAAD